VNLNAIQVFAKNLVTKLWGSNQWEAFNWIISEESGWNTTISNPYSGSYGLCQALPANKMATAGADYQTNPYTQINWCAHYIADRYGNAENARYFHLIHNWF